LIQGLAFQQGHRSGLLVANLQPHSQTVRLCSLADGKASLWRLNEDTMALASSDPDAFLGLSVSLEVDGGEVVHVMLPYEAAFLEILVS
jgi:hypothetical protein